MSLEDLGALGIVAAFVAMVYFFVRVCLASERSFLIKSLGFLAIYAAYCAAGVALVWWLAAPPAPQSRALAATLLALAWIGYGGVWLARLAPRGADHFMSGPANRLLDVGFVLTGLAALIYLIAGN